MAGSRESLAWCRAADGTELSLLVFEPAGGMPARAGLVLFHGCALRSGSAGDLAPHCRALASRGVFAASAGYRLLGRGAISIDDCLADVRCAVEQVTRLATSRGIEALASGGSSAGAHLALLAALTGPGVAAVVALNPAGTDLGSLEPEPRRDLERRVGIAEGRLTDYSLIELVRPGSPPVLIQHGTDDEVESIDRVRRFRDAMVRAGNACTLLEYQRAGHGFHHPGNGAYFDEVVDATVRFLG